MGRQRQPLQVKSPFFSPGVGDRLDELLRGDIGEAVARMAQWPSDTHSFRQGGPVPPLTSEHAAAAVCFMRQCAREKADNPNAVSPGWIAGVDPKLRNPFLELLARVQAEPRRLCYGSEWKRPDEMKPDDVRLARLVRADQLGLDVTKETQPDGQVYRVEYTGKTDEGIAVPDSVVMFFPEAGVGVQFFLHSHNLPGLDTEHIEQALFFKRTPAGWLHEQQDLPPGSCAVWTGEVFFLLRPEAVHGEEPWVTRFLEVVLFAWEVFLGLHELPEPKSSSAKPVRPGSRSRIGSCVRTYKRRGSGHPCEQLFVRWRPKKRYCGTTCQKHTAGYERRDPDD